MALLQISVPDGMIAASRQRFVLKDDPGQLAAALRLSGALNHAARGLSCGADPVTAKVLLKGREISCDVDLLEIPVPTLVIAVSCSLLNSERAYLLCAQRHPDGPQGDEWALASKLLLLPEIDPKEWGNGREALQQRMGRVLMFAGLVNMHGWYQV